MRAIEAEGPTIDAAIAGALRALGAERAQVHVDVLAGDSPGFLGIGRRHAKVRATMREPISVWLASLEPARGRPPVAASAPTRARPDEPSVRPEGAADPAVVVREILGHMGVVATVAESGTLTVPGEPAAAGAEAPRLLAVSGPAVGAIMGDRGEVLEALEYVLNRILDHVEYGGQRVALDAPGYRARRRSGLEETIRRMVARARDRRRLVTLDPMSPGDRRLVHEIVGRERGIAVRTTGHGFYRKVTLAPAGRRRGGGKKPR